jgi:hypothetical protein
VSVPSECRGRPLSSRSIASRIDCRSRGVTLLCYDPHEPLRYLEVRGRVIDITESGSGEHLDGLASKYAGRPTRFFGDSVRAQFAETEIPVIFRIRPVHVVAVDATRNRRTP